MREPEVLVPVTCPQCGAESMTRLGVSWVADALIAGKALRLTTKCHSADWEASESEIEQIREYMMASCIDLHGAPDAGASTELRM